MPSQVAVQATAQGAGDLLEGHGHGYGISYLNVYHGGGQVKRMR